MTRRDAVKNISDELPYISAAMLSKQANLAGGQMVSVITTLPNGKEVTTEIELHINIAIPYISIMYIHNGIGLRKSIKLGPSACSFGNNRWWLICPNLVEGRACNRRCWKLYLLNGAYACTGCHNLTYASRLYGRPRGLSGLYRTLRLAQGARRELAMLKRHFYRGVPTRKVRRLIRIANRESRQLGDKHV